MHVKRLNHVLACPMLAVRQRSCERTSLLRGALPVILFPPRYVFKTLLSNSVSFSISLRRRLFIPGSHSRLAPSDFVLGYLLLHLCQVPSVVSGCETPPASYLQAGHIAWHSSSSFAIVSGSHFSLLSDQTPPHESLCGTHLSGVRVALNEGIQKCLTDEPNVTANDKTFKPVKTALRHILTSLSAKC